MIEVGRVCVKLAGRDAGKTCVVVDVLDARTVLIDGQTRRRKCNLMHLEPLAKTVKVSKGASSDAVAKALKELKIEVKPTKPKKAAARPRQQRKVKQKPEAVKKKATKKAAKKTPKKAEEKPAKEKK